MRAVTGGELTDLWHKLRQRVLDFGARLLVIDTAADTFGGNEILRNQVRHFIRACLGRIALDMNGAVLLCFASGEGDAGSTAWSNSVRSPSGRAKYSRKKANYTARNAEIKLTVTARKPATTREC